MFILIQLFCIARAGLRYAYCFRSFALNTEKKLLPNEQKCFVLWFYGTHVIINGVMSISHLIDVNFCANGQETSLSLNVN